MKHLTMASRSLKSKLNKRANSKSNIIASSSSSSLSPDMDSSKLYRFNYLKSSALFLIIFVILVVVLGVSSNTRSKFVSVDHSPKFYSVDVVNVFPHDPNAFTQVISLRTCKIYIDYRNMQSVWLPWMECPSFSFLFIFMSFYFIISRLKSPREILIPLRIANISTMCDDIFRFTTFLLWTMFWISMKIYGFRADLMFLWNV